MVLVRAKKLSLVQNRSTLAQNALNSHDCEIGHPFEGETEGGLKMILLP